MKAEAPGACLCHNCRFERPTLLRALVALENLEYAEGHSCPRPQFPCEVCDGIELARRLGV